jgi:hypothetical protein
MKIRVKGADIDLREEMSELLDSNSYPVILIRTHNKMLCTCSSENGQQASSQCPLCLGTGKKIRAEVIQAIGRPASQYITLPNSTVSSSVGDIYSNAKMWYMDYKIKPTPGSFIYEVAWEHGNPSTLLSVYKIEYAEPARMDNGRTEYLVVGSHREITNIDFKQMMLKQLKLHRR